MQSQMQIVVIALIAIFVLYRIFRRLRRNFGWQRLNSRKLQMSTAILTILGIVLFALGASHKSSLISDVAGIVIGVILAYIGAAMTRFEQREGHLHYLPNTWIGAIVTVLFLGRILYRIYFAATQTDLAAADRLQSVTGGWTAGLMLVMVSYYVVYNIFLLSKQKRQLQQRLK
jgi:uncharacterized membrane protein